VIFSVLSSIRIRKQGGNFGLEEDLSSMIGNDLSSSFFLFSEIVDFSFERVYLLVFQVTFNPLLFCRLEQIFCNLLLAPTLW